MPDFPNVLTIGVDPPTPIFSGSDIPRPTIDIYQQPVPRPIYDQPRPIYDQPRPLYNMPPAPDTATAARKYRVKHGLATSDDTDALNAESLAAAQAGRNYFDPKLAALYAQPLAAGVYGPRTDVVNALMLPPSNG